MDKVICYADTDLVHAAYATTGLIELANAGQINLKFALSRDSIKSYRRLFTLLLSVNEQKLICLDFHDSNQYYCEASLDQCDRYYKSNWSIEGMAGLSHEQRAKVRAFGPYLPCQPVKDRSLALRALGNGLAQVRHRLAHPSGTESPVQLLRQMKHGWLGRYGRYRSRMKCTDYEQPSDSNVPSNDAPLVFFNPSCWAEKSASQEATNQLRADLIVGLRMELGDRFAGGLRRNSLAESKYPAALEDRHYSHADYVKYLHSAPISIYTNGLIGSFSWRMIENFAGGKAVVSEASQTIRDIHLQKSKGLLSAQTLRQ